jgi:hypothetical protein
LLGFLVVSVARIIRHEQTIARRDEKKRPGL